MNANHTEAVAAVTRCAALLTTRFGATRVIPFGSVRDPTAWHANSDLDLAVEGIAPSQFFRAWSSLQKELPPELAVDLVALEDAAPELRARILNEVDMAENRLDALQAVVNDELRALQRVVDPLQDALHELKKPPSQFEMNAPASYVHQFYTGCERILERIAVQIDGKLAQGAFSHANLLAQVAQPNGEIRPAILDENLWTRLQDYLQFRHFFRHAYGFMLEWEKLEPLAEDVPDILETFRQQLDSFFLKLKTKGKE